MSTAQEQGYAEDHATPKMLTGRNSVNFIGNKEFICKFGTRT